MKGEPLLLGVDLGTSRVKAGAFHLDGRLAAVSVSNYELAFDGATGAAEQDPNVWWTHLVRVLRQIVSQVERGQILAMCVGGQGPTTVAMDGKFVPTAPALTWMDRRAGQQAQRLSKASGREVPAHAFLPKAMWLQEKRPEAYAATRWFCQAWDFAAARLTGEPLVSTVPGIAPWDDELLAVSELDRKKFPPVRQMGEEIGRVTASAAAETGLPVGLQVIGGISDYFEGIIGSGALTKGVACDNGGSSTSFNVCWDAPLQTKDIFCVPSFNEGYWYVGGPASTTGKALDWWRSDVWACAPDDWTMLAEAQAIEPGSEHLIFLPYLAGERAPLWDAQARGTFFGLGLNHKRGHMTRAIMESVAFVLCHLIERIEDAGATAEEIHSCGGQAKSELWCRIKADATGRRVWVPQFVDSAVPGAAIIAGVGRGVFDDFVSGAGEMVRMQSVIAPNAARHARYQELFAVFRELYPAVQPLYARLNPA